MKIKFLTVLLCFLLLISACSVKEQKENDSNYEEPDVSSETSKEKQDLGDDSKTFGTELDDLGVYEGYFDDESKNIIVTYVSGTPNAYKLEGNTLTFTAVSEDTVYSVSGTFNGNIIISIGDNYKFDLELQGLSLVCDTTNPITVTSGNEVSVKAKKNTKNYIYDMREAVDTTNKNIYTGAIHSEVDLEIGGKGELIVISENNNGIISKDDLQVKNLTLFVACSDNALKGNDSVEILDCNTTLIASKGDCIKTSKSDLSTKNNQRGNISIQGGTHTIYAACDGIDASHNAIINSNTTVLNIYTDKYSNYSTEVTAVSSDVNYIRFTSNKYYYSVKYYNSETDFIWVNPEYHSAVSGGRTNYYYYSYPKMSEYSKQQFFIYEKAEHQGQDAEYLVMSDYLTPNSGCDTFALTNSNNGLYYEWTNYTTKIQTRGFGGPGGFGGGPGGFNEGNPDKGDHSTKGIKAANEIIINAGTVNIKSYDDALHTDKDIALENGKTSLGNITVNGGYLTLYSNDDGIHAGGNLSVKSGEINITNAYEGMEGLTVNIFGGAVSINSSDDGNAVSVSGGTLYIYCTGDGIDSNSRTAYVGITFSGGNAVIISNSGMNSAIDTENGYTYESGNVIAIMPRGGMSSEAKHCANFTEIGSSSQSSLTKDSYLVVNIKDSTATIKIPVTITAQIFVLGDKNANISTETVSSEDLDPNGVAWN